MSTQLGKQELSFSSVDRYIALKNDELGHGPLASYFKGEHLAGVDASLTTSNMCVSDVSFWHNVWLCLLLLRQH